MNGDGMGYEVSVCTPVSSCSSRVDSSNLMADLFLALEGALWMVPVYFKSLWISGNMGRAMIYACSIIFS